MKQFYIVNNFLTTLSLISSYGNEWAIHRSLTPPQGESGPSAEPKVARLLLPFHGNPSRKIESLYASKACIFPSSEAKQYRNGPSPSLTSKVLFKTSAVKLVEFIVQLFCTSDTVGIYRVFHSEMCETKALDGNLK